VCNCGGTPTSSSEAAQLPRPAVVRLATDLSLEELTHAQKKGKGPNLDPTQPDNRAGKACVHSNLLDHAEGSIKGEGNRSVAPGTIVRVMGNRKRLELTVRRLFVLGSRMTV